MSSSETTTNNKSTIRFDDEATTIEHYITVPPDGGWGWLIVAASFLVGFVIDGTIFCFGLFVDKIGADLQTSATRVASASSILSGFYYILGPFTCALINRFGFRGVGCVGGVVAALAFLLTSFVNDLTSFLVVCGFLGGVGFNFAIVPATLIVGFYFEQKRAIATSIAMCGSSMGVIVLPILADQLASYHWRTQFQLLAVLCAVCAVCAICYRPLEPMRVLETAASRPQVRQSAILFTRYHNAIYPTVSERSTLIGATEDSVSSLKMAPLSQQKSVEKLTTVFEERQFEEEEEEEEEVYEEGENNNNNGGWRGKIWKVLWKCIVCCRCRDERRRWWGLNESRPLYRDDIFFTGSIFTLDKYSQISSAKPPMVDYHLSVTRVTTREDLHQSRQLCICCPIAIVRILATMLDPSLIKSPSFALITISGFFTLLGIFAPYLFIVQRAQHEFRFPPEAAMLLLSVVGGANLLGRVVSGIVSSFEFVDLLVLSYVATAICGVATLTSAYLSGMIGQCSFAVVFGLSLGLLPATRTLILVELVGLDRLTNAFGISMLFNGVASFVAVPMAGALTRWSGSLEWTFGRQP